MIIINVLILTCACICMCVANCVVTCYVVNRRWCLRNVLFTVSVSLS